MEKLRRTSSPVTAFAIGVTFRSRTRKSEVVIRQVRKDITANAVPFAFQNLASCWRILWKWKAHAEMITFPGPPDGHGLRSVRYYVDIVLRTRKFEVVVRLVLACLGDGGYWVWLCVEPYSELWKFPSRSYWSVSIKGLQIPNQKVGNIWFR